MSDITIHGGRGVSLAVMTESYVDQLVDIINTPEVIEGVMTIPPVAREEELEWVKNLPKNKKNMHIFAVLAHEGEGRRFIGTMGLHKIRWPEGSCTSGSLLGSLEMLGQGYGTEAKLLLLKHAFDVLNLTTVKSEVKAFNGRSLGHLLKCGYQVIGTIPGVHPYKGGRVGEVLLYVTRELWEPIWNAYQADGTVPKLSEEQRELVRSIVEKTTKKE